MCLCVVLLVSWLIYVLLIVNSSISVVLYSMCSMFYRIRFDVNCISVVVVVSSMIDMMIVWCVLMCCVSVVMNGMIVRLLRVCVVVSMLMMLVLCLVLVSVSVVSGSVVLVLRLMIVMFRISVRKL